jgi:hypothetical protein
MRFAWAAAMLLAAGCAPPVGRAVPVVRHMGEHVEAGSLIYTVMETEWIDQLGSDLEPMLPEHRFLEVRIQVTNSGIAAAAIPEAALLAPGKSYSELIRAPGLRNWLGLLRAVGPAETVAGSLLFDVPFGRYLLRLGECSDPDDVKTGLVELPLVLPRPAFSFSGFGSASGEDSPGLQPPLRTVAGGIE